MSYLATPLGGSVLASVKIPRVDRVRQPYTDGEVRKMISILNASANRTRARDKAAHHAGELISEAEPGDAVDPSQECARLTPRRQLLRRPVGWETRRRAHPTCSSRCGHCRRQLYFRYAISAERTLILENDARGGVAVLRCVGCGEEPNTAAAYRSKSASETLPGCPYSAGGLSLLAGGANLSVQRAGLRAIGGADMHFRRGEVRSGRGQAVLELAVDPSDRLTEIAGAGGEL